VSKKRDYTLKFERLKFLLIRCDFIELQVKVDFNQIEYEVDHVTSTISTSETRDKSECFMYRR